MAYYVTFHTNIEYLSTIPKCGRMTLLYEIVVWNEMSHYPKLPSPAIIKQLQNFPWADQSRRFILSVGYLFRVRGSVWWPVNNFLLCCLHKKWSKRAEDVSICLTLISEECYEVAIVSTAHTFGQHWKYLLRRKLLNSPVSEALKLWLPGRTF